MAHIHGQYLEWSKNISVLDAEVVLKSKNVLGESCFFHAGMLKWLDIEGKKLWMMNVDDPSQVIGCAPLSPLNPRSTWY